MHPRSSPSSADVKHKINEYLQKASCDIISKLDNVGMKLNNYNNHSLQQDKLVFTHDYQQNPSSASKISRNTIFKLNFEEKYKGDITSTSFFKTHYIDGKTSIVPDQKQNQNDKLFESTYNGQNSKRRETRDLDLGVPSERNPYLSLEQPKSTSAFLDSTQYQCDQLHKTSYCSAVEPLSFADGLKQSSTSLYSDNGSSGLSPVNPARDRETALAAVKNHSGVWHRTTKGFFPPKTVPVAKTWKGDALFAGRVEHEGNIVPATILPDIGLAHYSWNGKVFCTNYYEILEIHQFAWEDESATRESVRAFTIGQTTEGTPLYLGRVYLEGIGLRVGRVHRDEKHIFIAIRGYELRIPPPYEVLVTF